MLSPGPDADARLVCPIYEPAGRRSGHCGQRLSGPRGALYYGWDDADGDGRVETREVDPAQAGPVRARGRPDKSGLHVPINRDLVGFGPPTTDEIIVGVERQIATDLRGSLAYTYRSRRRLDVLPARSERRTQSSQFRQRDRHGRGPATGLASWSFSEPYYGLTTVRSRPSGTELQNRPDTNQTYSGIEFQLIRDLLERVDGAREFRLQRLACSRSVAERSSNPNDETPGTNASGAIRRGGPINAPWQFNVSGRPAPLRNPRQAQCLRAAGVPDPVFRRSLDETRPTTRPLPRSGRPRATGRPTCTCPIYSSPGDIQVGDVTVTPQFACFNVLDSRTVLGRGGSSVLRNR